MLKYFAACVLPAVLIFACSSGEDVNEEVEGMLAKVHPQRAVGTACEATSNCSAGLECRVDHERHIADGQCTAPCKATEDCLALASKTMCIGAGICVATCTGEGDCPPQTRCGGVGWCERTGGGSSCSGVPTPCTMLSGTECVTAPGCKDSSSCSGSALGCTLLDVTSCVRQKGCTWSASTRTCMGTAAACSGLSFDFDCLDQRGCTWSASCSGTPASRDCSTQSPALCEFTPGCTLAPP
jgi:hypothetical protein